MKNLLQNSRKLLWIMVLIAISVFTFKAGYKAGHDDATAEMADMLLEWRYDQEAKEAVESFPNHSEIKPFN